MTIACSRQPIEAILPYSQNEPHSKKGKKRKRKRCDIESSLIWYVLEKGTCLTTATTASSIYRNSKNFSMSSDMNLLGFETPEQEKKSWTCLKAITRNWPRVRSSITSSKKSKEMFPPYFVVFWILSVGAR